MARPAPSDSDLFSAALMDLLGRIQDLERARSADVKRIAALEREVIILQQIEEERRNDRTR